MNHRQKIIVRDEYNTLCFEYYAGSRFAKVRAMNDDGMVSETYIRPEQFRQWCADTLSLLDALEPKEVTT